MLRSTSLEPSFRRLAPVDKWRSQRWIDVMLTDPERLSAVWS